ncbi:IS607 family transposase [Paraburkholderia sp. GAS42]|uniref:IS607 family transposase n=1 Tax=Paraburkholderia sp. GAS42 TaxID=3035135 RepID=UPI003D24BEEB
MRLLSIGETAAELGVAVGTLRRWHRQGLLMPFGRTVGGHRRYQRDTVRATLGAGPVVAGRTVCYARVSSHDRAGQLKTQAARLERHCINSSFADIAAITNLQRMEVWCASSGSPPGTASRAGVRQVPRATVATPSPSAGTTVTLATTICMCRFVHH